MPSDPCPRCQCPPGAHKLWCTLAPWSKEKETPMPDEQTPTNCPNCGQPMERGKCPACEDC